MKLKIKKSAIQAMINEAIKAQKPTINEAFKSKKLTSLFQTLDNSGGWNSSDKKWLFQLVGNWSDDLKLSEIPDEAVAKLPVGAFKPANGKIGFWFTDLESTKPDSEDLWGSNTSEYLRKVSEPFFKQLSTSLRSYRFTHLKILHSKDSSAELDISPQSWGKAAEKLKKKYNNPKDFVMKVIKPGLKKFGITVNKIVNLPDMTGGSKEWGYGDIRLNVNYQRVDKSTTKTTLLGITDGTKTLKGNKEYNQNMYKSMKDLKNNSKTVYVVDLDKAKETAGGRRDMQQARRMSREDALALKDNYEVYRENKARYKKLISASRVEKNEYDKDFPAAMERVTKIMTDWVKNADKYVEDDGHLKKPKFKTLSKKSYRTGHGRNSGYTSTDNNILVVQNELISAYAEYVRNKKDSSGSEYGAKLAKLAKGVLNDTVEYKWY